MFLDTIRENLFKGLRVILPKELEYKYGITEKSEPMVFEVGEGLSPEVKERAYDYIRSVKAPGVYTKAPFAQAEFALPEGFAEETLKRFVEMPEKITTSLKELPTIAETGKVPSYDTKLYRVPSYAEDYETLAEEYEKAGVPYPRLAAGLMSGGTAILDVSIVGSYIDMGAKAILARQPVSPYQVVAARQSMGLPKKWTVAERVKAYDKLAHITHPFKPTGSHQAFTRLNEANMILAKAETTPAIMRELGRLAEVLEKPISEFGKLVGQPYLGVKGLLPEKAGMIPTEPYQPYKFRPIGGTIKPSPMKPVPEPGFTPKPIVSKDLTPNLGKLKVSSDVKALITDVAKNYIGQIDAARRGVITHTQTKEMADALNMSPEQLLKRRKGAAMNAEELTASREILASSADEVSRLSKIARKTGATEDLVKFRQTLNRHIAIQSEVSGATAEVARALSAARIEVAPGELTPEFYNKVIETLGGRELTEEMAKRIAMIDPTDFVGMNKFLQGITKAKTTDKIFEGWINAILSSPATHLVNTTSNFLVRLSALPLKGTQVGLDFMRATITGTPRERFLGEIAADIVGMTKGFEQGAIRALQVWTTGLPPEAITKLEMTQRAAIPGLPGEIIRTPGKALVSEDEFFKALNSQAFLHSEAYRIAAKEGLKGKAKVKRMVELINDPTPEMLSAARAEELYRTFQKELGKWGKWIGKGRELKLGGVKPLRYIIPFIRTPVNILKFGMEMTPLNFLRLGYQKVRGKYPGVEFTDELAKPVMGAVLSATIAYYFSQDRITGHAPVDEEERDAFYREGKLPYSVKIGDTWYSYQRLEPIGTVIGLTADFCQDYDKLTDEDADKAVRAITSSITQNLINKTYMSGLSNFFNAINDPVRYGGDWLEMFTAGFIPQVMTTPTTMIDPYYRRAEGVVDAWKKKIPGLSETVPPVRDVWGTKAEKEGGILWRAISPIKKALERIDPVDKELKRIDYTMGFPSKTITGNFKLDAQHYDLYQKATGRKVKEVLDAVIKTPDYQGLSDEDKTKTVQKIVDEVRDRFRQEMTFVLFVEQMDIEIPPAVSQETAAQVYNALAKETKFKEASNDQKRELYTRNLHKFITY